jgi:hypothetical protein
MKQLIPRMAIILLGAALLVFGLAASPAQAQPNFGTGWTAVIFNNATASPGVCSTPFQNPVGTQSFGPNVDWEQGAPTGLPAGQTDCFSVRFTSSQTFTAGTYTFTVRRDDGVVVKMDGTVILNHNEGGTDTFQTVIPVSAGVHSFEIDYIEVTLNAEISFYWEPAAGGALQAGSGGGQIVYGSTVNGSVNPYTTQQYTFQANQGDVINIAVNATGGGLDPIVSLVSPQGIQIATNDDISFPSNINALIANFTIPSSGVYTIVVGGIETGGSYTMTLTLVTAAQQTLTVEVVRVRGLAVRTGPYLGATLIGVARPGTRYEVIGRNRDEGVYTWYQIRFPLGTTATAVPSTAVAGLPTAFATPIQQYLIGWSSGRYLTPSGNPETVPFQSTVFDQIDGAPDIGVSGQTNAPLYLRRRPSIRTGVMAEIPWGGVVTILGRTVQGGNSFWYHVRWNGMTGWAYAPYIQESGYVDALPIR